MAGFAAGSGCDAGGGAGLATAGSGSIGNSGSGSGGSPVGGAATNGAVGGVCCGEAGSFLRFVFFACAGFSTALASGFVASFFWFFFSHGAFGGTSGVRSRPGGSSASAEDASASVAMMVNNACRFMVPSPRAEAMVLRRA